MGSVDFGEKKNDDNRLRSILAQVRISFIFRKRNSNSKKKIVIKRLEIIIIGLTSTSETTICQIKCQKSVVQFETNN